MKAAVATVAYRYSGVEEAMLHEASTLSPDMRCINMKTTGMATRQKARATSSGMSSKQGHDYFNYSIVCQKRMVESG